MSPDAHSHKAGSAKRARASDSGNLVRLALAAAETSACGDSIPADLPLVSRCVSRFGHEAVMPLASANVVFAQHLVGDLVPFVTAAMGLGLAPERAWFLDIPYSDSAKVRRALEELGVPKGNFETPAGLCAGDPYETIQCVRSMRLMTRAIRGGAAGGASLTIVIDDGGHASLARYAVEREARALKHRVAIVEQTTHGMQLHRMFGTLSKLPVINVAESSVKVELESPVIGQTVVKRLGELVAEHGIALRAEDRVLVAGYGNIGRSVAREISTKFDIDEGQITIKPGFEEKYSRLQEGIMVGVPCRTLEGLHTVVIGCAGTNSFHTSHIPLLAERALLASASSWTVEFPKDEWLSAGEAFDLRDGSTSGGIHQTLEWEAMGRGICLANCGYPINFSGGVNSSPPEAMQLTVALMLAGLIHATDGSLPPGAHVIDSSVESWLVEQFKDVLSGESDASNESGT